MDDNAHDAGHGAALLRAAAWAGRPLRRRTRMRGWKRVWPLAVGLAAACAAIVTISDVAVQGTQRTHQLSVVISDASSTSSDRCAPDEYAGTFFDGATVRVEDAAGAALATATLGRPSADGDRGCSWTMSFDGVPESSGYVLKVTSTGTPPREYSFEYSPDRLETLDWLVRVSVIA
ncbi:hypothetical protein [Georgenia sp. SYP-B2076]|uniref:hypothetical protein n=1 Tax=Georgenia sp. SYP-B2076 TaxID=2495881 RepID=UPI000F8E8EA5|nr:hypothetical protein [Georgenia sp. SYP-B2076]